MKNLELLFTSIESKVSELETKERTRLLDEISLLREKANQLPDFKKESSLINLKYREEYIDTTIFFWKLTLKYKLFLSLGQFISDSDKISNISLNNGPKGLEIFCLVERESEVYNFYTVAVEAGGYNIQCFHYRYLTETKLPRVGDKTTAKIFRLMEEKEILEFRYSKHLDSKPTEESTSNYSPKMGLDWYLKNWVRTYESYQKQIEKIEDKIKTLRN